MKRKEKKFGVVVVEELEMVEELSSGHSTRLLKLPQ
jgi:hypothetical protein